MNMKKKKNIILIIAIVVLIAWILFSLVNEPNSKELTLKEQFIEAVEGGVSLDNSGFPPNETEIIKNQVDEVKNIILSKPEIEEADLVKFYQKVVILRDYDLAFAVFDILDQIVTTDYSYKVSKGELLLELKRWEEARQAFESIKVPWGRRETYIGLATAYENIENTPDYVIDDIYEESLIRNFRHHDVLTAYAHWAERSERPEKALKLYEEMQEVNPQTATEQKINELKVQIQNK